MVSPVPPPSALSPAARRGGRGAGARPCPRRRIGAAERLLGDLREGPGRADRRVVHGQVEVLVDPGLVRAEPADAIGSVEDVGGRAAALGRDAGLAGLRVVAGREGAAGPGEDVVEAEVQQVTDLVELVQRPGLVVGVVEDALEPGVALGVAPAGARIGPVDVLRNAVVDRDRAARVVDVAQEVGEHLARLRRLVAGFGELLDLVAAAAQRGGRRRSRRRRGCRARPSPASLKAGRLSARRLSPGAAARRSVSSGVFVRASVVELGQGRLQLGEEVVEDLEVAREIVAAGDRGLGGVAGLGDEADDVLAALGQLADHRVGVHVEVADDPVLRGQDRGDLAAAGRAPGRRAGSPR